MSENLADVQPESYTFIIDIVFMSLFGELAEQLGLLLITDANASVVDFKLYCRLRVILSNLGS